MLAYILRRHSWLYGFFGAAFLYVFTIMLAHGRGVEATFLAAVAFSVFSVLVALAQMLVIASGPGNIDLSVPSVMTLAAYLSMGSMGAYDRRIAIGVLVALAVGLVAGLLNYAAIVALRIPPIIATLASSFVFQSLAMDFGGQTTIGPPELLARFTNLHIGPIGVLAVLVVILTFVLDVAFQRSITGRHVIAIGQSQAAARLSGIRIHRVRLLAYAGSGLFASLAGFLLAGFTGGAALNMGDTYLMESIAVVVLGGTSVAGGEARPIGTWGGALFINLLTIMLNVFHVEVGVRFMLTGAIIILIVTLASRSGQTR